MLWRGIGPGLSLSHALGPSLGITRTNEQFIISCSLPGLGPGDYTTGLFLVTVAAVHGWGSKEERCEAERSFVLK